jgi:hypothetical protein
MFILTVDPMAYKNMPLIDPVLKTIALTYHKLITRCPATKPLIIKLFQTEIEGLSIQKNSSLDRKLYYDIALRKGGYTMVVLQKIIGDNDPTITEASYHIGTIMQLIDDMIDSTSDKRNGIHTIATYDFDVKTTIDELLLDTLVRVDTIHPKFTIFKILYTVFCVYIPDRLPEKFSSTLRFSTNKLNLFDCDGSNLLVQAIMSELTLIESNHNSSTPLVNK